MRRSLLILVAALISCFAGTARASLPINIYFSEDFTYNSGTDVRDIPSWDGSAANEIEIDTTGSRVKMSGGASTTDAYYPEVNYISYVGADNVIWVHFKAYPGTGTDTMWNLWFDDSAGNNMARYYGSATTCRGRVGGTNTVTVVYTLTPAIWNDLDIKIDMAANTATYYCNSFFVGTLDYGSTHGNVLGRIKFERMGNSLATGQSILFDELRVGQDPFGAPTTPPGAPTVSAPANGATVTTRTPLIQWNGDSHDMYEVHINTTNLPASSDGWNSGLVTSSATSCTSGILTNNTTYYVFVRLRNSIGWGNWSAAGRFFNVAVSPRIIPEPQQITWKPGTGFLIDENTRIVMNTSPNDNDTFTANQLRRKVWDMTGYLPDIIEGGAGAPTTNVIAIGDPARNTAVASIIATWPEATGLASKSEGYILGVKESSIVIRGFDQSGTFYGCQTLIQLLENFGTARISPLFCYDYPDLAMRGTMVRAWDYVDSVFLKEVISEVMARHKLNVLQIDMGMRVLWPSHPELYYGMPPEDQSPNPTTIQMMAPIADFAKQHFMDVVPAGPSWSHADGMITMSTMNTLLRENRSEADPSPDLETLCHRNPAAQQIMHDLWNDMITWFNPNYIHAGWDEISAIGHSSCPYCAGVSKTTLFKEFLTSDRDWMAARGIQMIMWADMLRPDMNGGSPWNLSQVAATMPKDIILEDWEYTHLPQHDNEASVQRWNSYGIPSLASPYGGYTPFEYNIYRWASLAEQYDTRGLVAFNKFRCGSKQGVFNNVNQWMEVGNMIFYGEWSWTANTPTYTPLPYDGETTLRGIISPDKPSGFIASLNGSAVNLNWTNPPDSTFQYTWIIYRTDRFPTDPTDGVFVAEVAGAPNSSGFFSHASAPMGATIYYAAFSHDGVRHFSPIVTASVANGSPYATPALSSIPDGETVSVNGIVTAIYDGFFYIEDEKRITGIRVESDEAVSIGAIRMITGPLGKTGMERSITALLVTGTDIKDPVLDPVAMPNSVIGGSDKGFTPGAGVVGLNNVGILISSVGSKEVVAPDNSYFFIDDGSVPGGIKVMLTGTKLPITIPSGTYFMVTGASSLDSDGKAVIRPRDQGDIVAVM
ncbi:MAG: glycoside hydrolase family 20 zincin-like fold domain-containing protein [Armatimonadota bacterium]|nr:glycoside hydrolase family 20 zincin-like fold domain-containing protein [Armatimonadota bacterium]